MSEHTQGPWAVFDNREHPGHGICVGTAPEGRNAIAAVWEPTGDFWWPESEDECLANAAFIVRACNSHEALVEALEACLIMFRSPKPRKLEEALSWRENDEKALAMAHAALKLAKP